MMSTAQVLRDRWEQTMRRDLPDFMTMIADATPRGARGVEYAIDLRAWRPDLPLATEYAVRAARETQAQLDSRSYDPGDTARDEDTRQYLVNTRKAPILRGLAYAKAIAESAWDEDLLREASATYEAASVHEGRGWHVAYQWDRHSAVLLALLTGDTERAASLLAYKRSFKDTQRFHDSLKRTVTDIERGGGRLLPESPEEAAFQQLFDVIRQPEPNATAEPLGGQAVSDVSYRRFELAVVKERYVAGNTGIPQWDRVFRSISE